MRTSLSVLVASAAIALAACATTHGITRVVNGVSIVEDKPGLWERATLAPDSAIKIAVAKVPGGQIAKAELEMEDGKLIYSFEIKVAGKDGEDEIHIDAGTGAVLKHEHEG
jgi:uncharacterized membrane protein YkoI